MNAHILIVQCYYLESYLKIPNALDMRNMIISVHSWWHILIMNLNVPWIDWFGLPSLLQSFAHSVSLCIRAFNLKRFYSEAVVRAH